MATNKQEQKTVFEQVQEIISNQLGIDKGKILETTDLQTDLKADSLEVAEMLFIFEDTFSITLGEEDALNLKTVKDIADLVAKLKA